MVAWLCGNDLETVYDLYSNTQIVLIQKPSILSNTVKGALSTNVTLSLVLKYQTCCCFEIHKEQESNFGTKKEIFI